MIGGGIRSEGRWKGCGESIAPQEDTTISPVRSTAMQHCDTARANERRRAKGRCSHAVAPGWISAMLLKTVTPPGLKGRCSHAVARMLLGRGVHLADVGRLVGAL